MLLHCYIVVFFAFPLRGLKVTKRLWNYFYLTVALFSILKCFNNILICNGFNLILLIAL